MGLFDTFICNPPILCNSCGNKINKFQSKSFGQTLETYNPGEIVVESHIHYGIVEESIYCDSCSNNEMKIFMVVWHNVYAGYGKDEQEANNLLESIDRLNILKWLDKCQIEKKEWKRRFSNLYNSMEELRLYFKAADKQEFLSTRKLFRTNNWGEHLQTDDPFLSILNEFKDIMHNTADDIFE